MQHMHRDRSEMRYKGRGGGVEMGSEEGVKDRGRKRGGGERERDKQLTSKTA